MKNYKNLKINKLSKHKKNLYDKANNLNDFFFYLNKFTFV